MVGGAAVAVLGKIGYAILTYANLALAARLLGTTNFGFYSVAITTVASLATVSIFGAERTILAVVPKHLASSPDHARGILTWITRRTWALSCVLAAALVLGASSIARAMGEPGGAPFFVTIGLALPFVSTVRVTKVGGQVLRAFVAAIMTSQLLQAAVLQILLLIGLVAGGFAPETVALCYTGSFVITAAVAVRDLSRRKPFGQKWLTGRAKRGSDVGRLSVRFAAIDLCTNLQTSVVVYVLASVLAPDAVAFFHAAQRTANLSSFILVGVNFVISPLIAGLWEKQQREELSRIYQRGTKWSLAISMVACLVILAAAPGILSVFGREFVAAVPALVVLTLGQLVNAAVGPVAYLLMMTGEERSVLAVRGGATVVTGILTAVVAPRFGVTGAAVVLALSMAGTNGLLLVTVASRMGLQPYSMETLRVLGAGGIGAVAAVVIYPISWPAVGGSTFWGTVMAACFVLITSVVALLVVALNEEDRAFLVRLRGRFARSDGSGSKSSRVIDE